MAKAKQLKSNKEKVNNKPAPAAKTERVHCIYNPFFFRENEGSVKTIIKL
jgi:hypothetical protein